MTALRSTRRSLRMKQQTLAKRLNVDVGTLRDWELGRSRPNYRNRLKIVAFLEEVRL